MFLIRTLVLSLCLVTSAWAAPVKGDDSRPICKPPFERSLEALKPAPDLEKKLRAIDEKQGDLARQARSDMRDKKRALYQGFETAATNEEGLKKLFDAFNATSSDLNKARFESELQVWRLLTPEQRKVWFTYRKCPRDGMMMPKNPPMPQQGGMMPHQGVPMKGQMDPKDSPMPMDSPMDDR